jgi:hypothetical protein
MSQTFAAKQLVVTLPEGSGNCFKELEAAVKAKKAKIAEKELHVLHEDGRQVKKEAANRLEQLIPLVKKSADTVVQYRKWIEMAENTLTKKREALKKLSAAMETARKNKHEAKKEMLTTGEQLHTKEVKLHEEKRVNGWKGNPKVPDHRNDIQKHYKLYQVKMDAYATAKKTYKTAQKTHDDEAVVVKQKADELDGLQNYSTTVNATHDTLELIKSTWRKLGNVAEDFNDKAVLFERELHYVDGTGSEEKRVKEQFGDLAELWTSLTGLLEKGNKAEKGFVFHCSKGRWPMKPGMFPAGADEKGLLCSKCL